MNENGKQKKEYRISLFLLKTLGIVYGMLCTYLYYMQSLQPLDYNNRFFQSDLPYHISMVVDDGWYYSFTAYVYELLYGLWPGKTLWIAVFLGCVTYGSLLLTENVLAKMLKKDVNTPFIVGSALILQLMMPFYVSAFGAYRYVSYQSGNLWHNSTYICMRALSLLCVWLFLDYAQSYKERCKIMDWTTFSAALLLCTGVKPSFLTVFAPIMACMLLWDLFHKVSFGKIVFFGTTVFPACGIMLWQNAVLFGEDTGNGMTINPWYTFSLHADRPKAAVLCSLAFPIVVFLGMVFYACLMKKASGDVWNVFYEKMKEIGKSYLFFAGMAVLGFILALLLVETGARERDGNFLWGYCIGIFFLQIVSFLILAVQLSMRKYWASMGQFAKICLGAIVVIESLVLLYQLWCGVFFWIRLLLGETYFMVM